MQSAIYTYSHTSCCSVHRDLLQSVSHLQRRVTVQAIMFRGLYLLRQMFTVLAKFQQAIIFTSGPWGIEKACWFSCLLPMLILFSMGNLSIVQFWFIYTRKVQINSVYSISTGHNCCSLPGPERHNGKESGNEMFPFSFETKQYLNVS